MSSSETMFQNAVVKCLNELIKQETRIANALEKIANPQMAVRTTTEDNPYNPSSEFDDWYALF